MSCVQVTMWSVMPPRVVNGKHFFLLPTLSQSVLQICCCLVLMYFYVVVVFVGCCHGCVAVALVLMVELLLLLLLVDGLFAPGSFVTSCQCFSFGSKSVERFLSTFSSSLLVMMPPMCCHLHAQLPVAAAALHLELPNVISQRDLKSS